ncbi:hypothetical protein HMPREF0971_01664 [Segatella oris F0302]|uniref:Uncharacterized protein n=1 Tax=Segatella oris F0302 TaxID=649760 RepID=D1QRQ8_9BACT|nr:hypothetical protein [Segatella oris]EFB31915.1 hypothetical protein HMPREF0971_01664 [Segatella oris F0302]
MMYNDLKLLFKHATIILVILLFVRCCFAVAFVPLGIFADHPGILPLFFFNILRFDVQIICYILLLPTTLTLIVTAVRKPWTARFLSKFRRIYFSVIDVLVLMIGGIDLGFYANFNSHINLTFFDFFNEGPISLLQTIWEEYHCVWTCILTHRDPTSLDYPQDRETFMLCRYDETEDNHRLDSFHRGSDNRLERFYLAVPSANRRYFCLGQ